MATKKISELIAAAAAVGTDQHEVNQGGVSKRLTNAQIATYMETAFASLTLTGGGIALNADGGASFGTGQATVDSGGNIAAKSISINGGVAQIFDTSAAEFASGDILLNANGSASFAGGIVQISNAGDVTLVNGGLDVASAINTASGFSLGGTPGVTQDVVIGGTTLHFEGGILTSVT